jgi:hypothetical protein
MIAVAYHFHVLPRHHDALRFAYRSAREALAQTLGLVSHEFADTFGRRQPFSLYLAWDDATSYERFTRSWIGVWLINGMGLAREAFIAPVETDLGVALPDLSTIARRRQRRTSASPTGSVQRAMN